MKIRFEFFRKDALLHFPNCCCYSWRRANMWPVRRQERVSLADHTYFGTAVPHEIVFILKCSLVNQWTQHSPVCSTTCPMDEAYQIRAFPLPQCCEVHQVWVALRAALSVSSLPRPFSLLTWLVGSKQIGVPRTTRAWVNAEGLGLQRRWRDHDFSLRIGVPHPKNQDR